MSNPSGPDQPDEAADEVATDETEQPEPADDAAHDPEPATEVMQADPEHEPATEIMVAGGALPTRSGTRPISRRSGGSPRRRDSTQARRRGSTPPPEPATEVFSVSRLAASRGGGHQQSPSPKSLRHRSFRRAANHRKPPRTRRSWGWVVALLLVIAALVAVAILGTVLLTRGSEPKVSQEDMVRTTIQNFDVAVQKGDLATLRSITCGTTRDSYVNYDERAWTETHARVAAAKQYPVVASIDQVVVNGDHAEANVTTFMAYAPQTRSTRSFDLQFRDDQWKICQAPDG